MNGYPQKKTGKTGRKTRGQSVFEYALLITLVSVAFLTMTMYVKRAVQGQLYNLDSVTVAKANETVGVNPPTVGAIF